MSEPERYVATIRDAEKLLKRSESKLLRGWGMAEQSLTDG